MYKLINRTQIRNQYTDLISYKIKSLTWFAPNQDSVEINEKSCTLELNFPSKQNLMKLQSNLKQENVDKASNSREIYEEKLS